MFEPFLRILELNLERVKRVQAIADLRVEPSNIVAHNLVQDFLAYCLGHDVAAMSASSTEHREDPADGSRCLLGTASGVFPVG